MPLHDWSDQRGWESVQHLWLSELLYSIKPRLPGGYRAYIGTSPILALGSPLERSDSHVHPSPKTLVHTATHPATDEICPEPDQEIAVAVIDSGTALFVEKEGRVVSAVELVSPRNKDRPITRHATLGRYIRYLFHGVNLLLIDVHPRPQTFSFSDSVAEALQVAQAHCPAPFAVTYRVGEYAATGGRFLAKWQRALAVGTPLPKLPLPLTVDNSVLVDLEQTYSRAAANSYLS